MKKSFTLQPYFPEVQYKANEQPVDLKIRNRFRRTLRNNPSQLALRNILGFAAACNFQKTELQGSIEVVIN